MSTSLLFQPAKSGKASHKIVHDIRKHILHGQLKPGDKLPPEQSLLDSFSVSRQTLREALRVLEMQGLLQIRAGAKGGVFVAEVDMNVTKNSLVNFLCYKDLSISHLSDVRQILEPHFAAAAAKNMTDAEIEELGNLLEKAKEHLASGDTVALRKNEIQFHWHLAQASKNPLLILLQDFIENLLEDAKRILQPDEAFSHRVMAMHEKIFIAIKNRNAEEAAKYIIEDVVMVEESLQELAQEHETIQWI